ncbi:hypothetical protein H6F74_05585 [Trichocoleus sp. FACHB-90]|uniref:hypothetical protein n=1 Tax=Cyanophyceae TaxID=3028117 RepID=UPI001685C588|nr:hypothetical protein [Trichocoleus sp. FACHB-90]MBD1925754.1 hypothetical protein [Trichocoleus sp. FACHB-90]
MASLIDLSKAAGRLARKEITADGVRRFAVNAMSGKADSGDGGGILGKIIGAVGKFNNSLINGVAKALFSFASFTLSGLWGLVISTGQFLWNFDFNMSEEAADKKIEALYTSLAGSLGNTLGNAVGWLACGALPGAIIFAFNEPLGLHVLNEVGEEALEEIADNVAQLIRQTATQGVQVLLTWAYINYRKLWRQPNSEFAKMLAAGGLKKEYIDRAVEERSKPWSFALKFEEAIESIDNKYLRTFAENFFEEAFDACVEAGYVVANSVDSYLAAQKIANNGLLGEERTVEILLDRSTATAPTP